MTDGNDGTAIVCNLTEQLINYVGKQNKPSVNIERNKSINSSNNGTQPLHLPENKMSPLDECSKDITKDKRPGMKYWNNREKVYRANINVVSRTKVDNYLYIYTLLNMKTSSSDINDYEQRDNKSNDITNVNHVNKGTETSDNIRNKREKSTKYIRKGTHLQKFPLNKSELKNASDNPLESIMRKKNINKDNQLIEFLTNILHMKNDSEHMITNFPKTNEHCNKVLIANTTSSDINDFEQRDNKINDRTNVSLDNKDTETSDIIRKNRENSTKYICKGTHLQEFPLNIFELKNDSVNQLENIMRKKHIN